MAKRTKYEIWQKKRERIKYRIMRKNVNNLPRLVIYRSNSNIYAQLVDDQKKETILSASSIDKNIKKLIDKASTKVQKSKIVG